MNETTPEDFRHTFIARLERDKRMYARQHWLNFAQVPTYKQPKFDDPAEAGISFEEKAARARAWWKDEKEALVDQKAFYAPSFAVPEPIKLAIEFGTGASALHTLRHSCLDWAQGNKFQGGKKALLTTALAAAAVLLDLGMHKNEEIKHRIHEIDDNLTWLGRVEQARAEAKKTTDSSPSV